MATMNLFKCLIRLSVVLCAAATYSQAATILDPAGDIDPGIATGNGTLDILSMEVSSNGTYMRVRSGVTLPFGSLVLIGQKLLQVERLD